MVFHVWIGSDLNDKKEFKVKTPTQARLIQLLQYFVINKLANFDNQEILGDLIKENLLGSVLIIESQEN